MKKARYLTALFTLMCFGAMAQYFPQSKTDTVYPEGMGFRAGITQATKVRSVAPSGDALTMTADVEAEQTVNICLLFTGSIIIDWGDGSDPENAIDGSISECEVSNSHQYPSARSYNISITGDLSGVTALDCSSNSLTSLDVSGCTALTYLGCSSNSLTSLDVSSCTALTMLGCSSNSLTSLDVSSCTALTMLGCSYNSLTSLDVSSCTALTTLACYSNALTELDVSSCTALIDFACFSNSLTESAISTLIGTMFDRSGLDPGAHIIIPMNETFPQTLTEGQTNALTAKNWVYDP